MAVQQALNVFTGGLNKDLNPISLGNDTLTDALNATTITFNGNELLLLNDMGNTNLTYYPKVYNSDDGTNTDSPNCEMVKLKDGYIPIGMKEFGDIVYIVSHNPMEKRTEIGSFPGPDFLLENIKPEDITNSKDLFNVTKQNLGEILPLHRKDIKLQVGDKLIFNFDQIVNSHIISSSTEAKLLKPKFINFLTGNDITDSLKYDFSTNTLEMFYPNIENGLLGLYFECEKLPKYIFNGLRNYENLDTAPKLYFNDILNVRYSYFTINKLQVEYTLTNLDAQTGVYLEIGTKNYGLNYIEYIDIVDNLFKLPDLQIKFTGDYYNTVRFTAKFTPILDINDYNGNSVLNEISKNDFVVSDFTNTIIDPIIIYWDLDKSIDTLSGVEKTHSFFTSTISDYNNIVASRNIEQDLSIYFKPTFTTSDWKFTDTSNGGYYNNSLIYYYSRDSKTPKAKSTIHAFSTSYLPQDYATKLWDISKLNYHDVMDNTGGVAIFAQHPTYGSFDGDDWSAELTVGGELKSNVSTKIYTNLLGNLNNVITDKSKFTYSSSDTNFGAIIYPGGCNTPSETNSDGLSIFGTIKEWDSVGTRNVNYDLKFSITPVGSSKKTIWSNNQSTKISTTPYTNNGLAERDRGTVSTLIGCQEDIIADCPIIKISNDSFEVNSVSYEYYIKTWNKDYGEGKDVPGAGTNGLLIYPCVGSVQSSLYAQINKPRWDIDILIGSYTLPPKKEIQIEYIANYIDKESSLYKLDLYKNILINLNLPSYSECKFYTNGQIIENSLLNNTIMYNKYTARNYWQIYNAPSYGYYTVAYYGYASLSNVRELFEPGSYLLKKEYPRALEAYSLYLYLIDSNTTPKFRDDILVINPIIYSSTLAKYNDGWQIISKPTNINNLKVYTGNLSVSNGNEYWIDPQVLCLEELKVNTPQTTEYYYNNSGSGNKITSQYIPEPFYIIKSIKYT